MAPSYAGSLHRGARRQQLLLELEGRQRREEARDLHVEQVGRAGHARRTILHDGGDDDLLTALPAEGDEGRPLAIEEGGVEADPPREELLRLREHVRGGERGAEFLERALRLVHDGAVSGRMRNSDRRCEAPQDGGNAELRPEARSAAGRSDQPTGTAKLRPEVRSAAGRSDQNAGPAELRPEVRSAAGRSYHQTCCRARVANDATPPASES